MESHPQQKKTVFIAGRPYSKHLRMTQLTPALREVLNMIISKDYSSILEKGR
jgi:hypothetical protein